MEKLMGKKQNKAYAPVEAQSDANRRAHCQSDARYPRVDESRWIAQPLNEVSLRRTMVSPEDLARALALPDLTEMSRTAPHAVALAAQSVLQGLVSRGWPQAHVEIGERVVDALDNYALLGYHPDEVTLGSAHTRWVSSTTLLRTQMTCLIPAALTRAAGVRKRGERLLIAAPGITYRRDVRDRWHCAEPHQMDLWLLCDACEATDALLQQWVSDAVESALPDHSWILSDSPHYYTEGGQELNVQTPSGPIELLECGRVARSMLERLGVDPSIHGGLALGMGLDRLAMLRKGIPDIRLLRSDEPRVAIQMQDLKPWRPVSNQPAAKRNLSVAVTPGLSEEALTERLLRAAGDHASWVESLYVAGRWAYHEVQEAAAQRLGLLPGQENVLLRVELRDWGRSIPKAEANALYSRLQEALHEGIPGGGYKLPLDPKR
jgi:phenylalanyl-tRNA synthetase alpha chain